MNTHCATFSKVEKPPMQQLRSVFFRICMISGIVALLVGSGCSISGVKKADRLVATGQWDQAVESYKALVKQHPFNKEIQADLSETKVLAAEFHYEQGNEALERDDTIQALQEFKKAIGLDPSRAEYHARFSEALRIKKAKDSLQTGEKLESLGRIDEAMSAYEQAVGLDPKLGNALERITALTKHKQAEKKFIQSTEPVTLRFQKAKLREVFEVLARTAGVNVVFDKDVRDDPVTIFLKDMPYNDALNLILHTNKLFSQRIGPNTLLIIPNSKQKLDQYQDLMIRTFYLSNTKAKNVVNLLRSMLESKRVFVDEKINALVIRDVPAKIYLAERIIQSIDRRDPEVMLDLEVLEVNRTKSLEYGLNLAKRAGAAISPDASQGSISASPTPFTYQQLTSIGTGSYLFTFPASVLLDFFKQESDAKTLAAPKLRVLSNETASITVGDKQPILLSTTNVLPGQAATGAIPTTSTVTSIEFKDTGVKLTVEPIVHLVDELTLKIKVEVTRLGDEVILQASPEIKQFKFGTRTAETTLRIRDDETVVLAGLLQDENRKTRVTIPWLGDIPILGELFSSTTTEAVETEVVLAITPHIIRNLETPGPEGQAFWSGTETNYSTEQLFPKHLISSFENIGEDTNGETLPIEEEFMFPLPPSDPSTNMLNNEPELQLPKQSVPNVEPGASISNFKMPQPYVKSETSVISTPPHMMATQNQAPERAKTSHLARPDMESPGELGKGHSETPGLITVHPQNLLAKPGQEFQVEIQEENLQTLAESVLTITFNPKQIEFLRASGGTSANTITGSVGSIVTTKPGIGQVVLHIRRSHDSIEEGVSLVSLFFKGTNHGNSPIMIHPAFVHDARGHNLAFSAQSGTITIQ